jgi:hypothetical protein
MMRLATSALAFAGSPDNPTRCPSGEAHHALSRTDKNRAASPRARSLTGSSADEISEKLNRRLNQTLAEAKPCVGFTESELDGLFRKVFCHRSPLLENAYGDGDGRMLLHDTIEEYQERWEREYQADGHPAASRMEGKCAHILMVWTHHLTAAGKALLLKEEPSLTLPSLPTYHAAAGSRDASYAQSFTCVTGHNNTGGSSDHIWPHWPDEVHYTATGHGSYPFWLGFDGTNTSGYLEVWWSQSKAAEKFYHESCAMGEAGYAQRSAPCYHLMLGTTANPQAYLYTATEDFCCVSQPTAGSGGLGEQLTAPQADFMDQMTNRGPYTLPAPTKYNTCANDSCVLYTMELPTPAPPAWFWYITTKEGLPVQQGEGGRSTLVQNLWHDYNTSSFTATTHDPSVFAIPSICKATTNYCPFP